MGFSTSDPILAPDAVADLSLVRNTYTYINFGDFVAGSPSDRADPYIQLLSTTNDTTEAHIEFIQIRGGSTTPYPNTIPVGSNTPPSTQPTRQNQKKLFILIGACTIGGLILIAVGLLLCCRRRGSSRAIRTSTFGPYAPLGAPAPAPATDIRMGSPKHQYNERWAVSPHQLNDRCDLGSCCGHLGIWKSSSVVFWMYVHRDFFALALTTDGIHFFQAARRKNSLKPKSPAPSSRYPNGRN